MNAMGFRLLALVAGIGVGFASNTQAADGTTRSAASLPEEKTAFFGLPFFGGCNGGGCYSRPICAPQPCYPRPVCGTPCGPAYPVSGGYGRPYPYGVPAYSAPGYVMPGYGVPAYGAPGYGVPAYGVPGYYGPFGAAGAPASASPYLSGTPVINTSGYRGQMLPGSLDDPYFP